MTPSARDKTRLSACVSRRMKHRVMAAVGFSKNWFIFSADTKLVAVDTKQNRDPFVFDCSSAEKKTKRNDEDNNSEGGASEETGSDRVLAFAASPSGRFVALTDDSKRLILFQSEPAWKTISTRCVVRRCTSLTFSQSEDRLLVSDKSGDVYSFSVLDPEQEGQLMMGHLSMLLSVSLSPDDKFIITADRDEKIRVSRLDSPYDIQAFCLGHRQFVSSLLVPAGHPHWLLSGSGDGTMKLWEFESGRQLQSCDLTEDGAASAEDSQKPSVCRISSSPDTQHIAVQCERVSTLHVFTLDQNSDPRLVPHSRLQLTHCPLDVTFDLQGRLWVLLDSRETPLQIYSLRHGSWECEADGREVNTVTEALKLHWDTLEASSRTSGRFDHLHKVSFDNVGVYLEKKQQRLQEQQLKKNKNTEREPCKKNKNTEGEPCSKKTKEETL